MDFRSVLARRYSSLRRGDRAAINPGLVAFAALVAYVALTHSDEEGAHAAHAAHRTWEDEPIPELERD